MASSEPDFVIRPTFDSDGRAREHDGSLDGGFEVYVADHVWHKLFAAMAMVGHQMQMSNVGYAKAILAEMAESGITDVATVLTKLAVADADALIAELAKEKDDA